MNRTTSNATAIAAVSLPKPHDEGRPGPIMRTRPNITGQRAEEFGFIVNLDGPPIPRSGWDTNKEGGRHVLQGKVPWRMEAFSLVFPRRLMPSGEIRYRTTVKDMIRRAGEPVNCGLGSFLIQFFGGPPPEWENLGLTRIVMTNTIYIGPGGSAYALTLETVGDSWTFGQKFMGDPWGASRGEAVAIMNRLRNPAV